MPRFQKRAEEYQQAASSQPMGTAPEDGYGINIIRQVVDLGVSFYFVSSSAVGIACVCQEERRQV